MDKSIEVLMNEHRLIEQVLGSLETMTLAAAVAAAPERGLLSEYGSFFSEFADARHHGKEEDILFRRMLENGFPREQGPLAVMLYEHELGRGHVRAIRAAGEGAGPLGADEAKSVLEHASAFVPLLRGHIQKEDRILYPMAVRLLGDSQLDAMAVEFEAFEKRSGDDGSREHLLALADRLTSAYRPDAERMAAAAALGCCG